MSNTYTNAQGRQSSPSAAAELLASARAGTTYDFGGRDAVGRSFEQWTLGHTIEGSLIAAIAAGDHPSVRKPKAIRIHGATIAGPIELSRSTILCPLEFTECSFLDNIFLSEAQVPEFAAVRSRIRILIGTGASVAGMLHLRECWIDRVALQHAEISRRLFLTDSTIGWTAIDHESHDFATIGLDRAKLFGGIDISGANIRGRMAMNGSTVSGQFKASGATLSNYSRRAFSADGAAFESDAILNNVTCNGELALLGATVNGQLDLQDTNINNGTSDGLSADSIRVTGGFFAQGLNVTGTTRLPNAKIEGRFMMRGATLRAPEDDGPHPWHVALLMSDAVIAGGIRAADLASYGDLDLARVKVTGGIRCPQISCIGTLSLSGANVNGPIDLAHGRFEDESSDDGRCAILANHIFVRGAFELIDATCVGGVMINGALIDGEVDLSGAHLNDPGGLAITGDRSKFKGGIFASKVSARGEFRLSGSIVSGSLNLRYSKLENHEKDTLFAEGAEFGAVLADGIATDGRVVLSHSTVFDVLALRAAQSPDDPIVLSHCKIARVEASGLACKLLDIQHAEIGTLSLDFRSTRPSLLADGARYNRLRPIPTIDAIEAIESCSQSSSPGEPLAYQPSMYEALEHALRASGDEDLARRVGAAKHRRRRTHGAVSGLDRALSYGYGTLVGYGYAPARLLLWFAALAIVGVIMCSWIGSDDTHWTAVRSPCPSSASKSPACSSDAESDLAGLRRGLFAADTVLPVIDLGQQSRYTVNGVSFELWYAVTVCLSWVLGILLVTAMGKRLVRD